VAFTAITFSGYGVGSWLPSFYVRTFGWSIGKASLWLGLNAAITASVSVLIGGALADHWYRQGKKDAKMRVPLLGSILWLVPGFAYLLAPTGTLSMTMFGLSTLVGTIGIGCVVASLQELMPNRMRGKAVALYAVIANLIGMGFGPTAVALLTDYVFGDESKLRYSIVIVAALCHLTATTALAFSLKPYRKSVEEIERGAPA
jgi:MFS family permease